MSWEEVWTDAWQEESLRNIAKQKEAEEEAQRQNDQSQDLYEVYNKKPLGRDLKDGRVKAPLDKIQQTIQRTKNDTGTEFGLSEKEENVFK